MSKPDDIPQGVWETSRKVWLAVRRPEHTGVLPTEAIARAILAERERCAKVARDLADRFSDDLGDDRFTRGYHQGKTDGADVVANAIEKGE